MRAWPAPEVPSNAWIGARPRIWDSRAQALVELPLPSEARLYVCGITPYDATHLGHAATYVAFDTLHRVWLANGIPVHFVQNITDVDDPLLERAQATGQDWRELAESQIALFRDDMTALRVIPPRDYVGVVESLDLVEVLLDRIIAAGAAYRVETDIYYDISKTDLVGSIGHFSAKEMLEIFAQRGGDPDRLGKRHPLDPLLWRSPSEPQWHSRHGDGRPGWHIECSAIAVNRLGAQIHVQGGGSDLKFPHHEMSAAHAQTATGKQPFAEVFVHTGMVGLGGEKMSKSLGNLVFVSRLIAAGTDPMAVRLAILANHYRSDWEWSDEVLRTAESRLANYRQALRRPTAAPAPLAQLCQALAADLNTPSVLQILDSWCEMSGTDTQAAREVALWMDGLLGLQ